MSVERALSLFPAAAAAAAERRRLAFGRVASLAKEGYPRAAAAIVLDLVAFDTRFQHLDTAASHAALKAWRAERPTA